MMTRKRRKKMTSKKLCHINYSETKDGEGWEWEGLGPI
jgi:hypothetical protein